MRRQLIFQRHLDWTWSCILNIFDGVCALIKILNFIMGFIIILIDPFPIIGFYLYHVISAYQSNNWTTSGIWSRKNLLLILHAFHIYSWWLKHQTKGKWQLYLSQLYMMTKRINFISNLSNLHWTKPWILSFKWYDFHNYFRCCWRRSWWDDVFPCGSTLCINFHNNV